MLARLLRPFARAHRTSELVSVPPRRADDLFVSTVHVLRQNDFVNASYKIPDHFYHRLFSFSNGFRLYLRDYIYKHDESL